MAAGHRLSAEQPGLGPTKVNSFLSELGRPTEPPGALLALV